MTQIDFQKRDNPQKPERPQPPSRPEKPQRYDEQPLRRDHPEPSRKSGQPKPERGGGSDGDTRKKDS